MDGMRTHDLHYGGTWNVKYDFFAPVPVSVANYHRALRGAPLGEDFYTAYDAMWALGPDLRASDVCRSGFAEAVSFMAKDTLVGDGEFSRAVASSVSFTPEGRLALLTKELLEVTNSFPYLPFSFRVDPRYTPGHPVGGVYVPENRTLFRAEQRELFLELLHCAHAKLNMVAETVNHYGASQGHGENVAQLFRETLRALGRSKDALEHVDKALLITAPNLLALGKMKREYNLSWALSMVPWAPSSISPRDVEEFCQSMGSFPKNNVPVFSRLRRKRRSL